MKTKKILSLLVVLAMIATVVVLPMSVSAAQVFTDGDFNYTVSSNTARVYEYIGEGGDVVIPSTLGGYPVVRISPTAFTNKKGVTSVVIPEGVTTINSGAFGNCDDLESITLPFSLETIADEAFVTSKLADVYYSGTTNDWNDIDIGDDNDDLYNATMHYASITNYKVQAKIAGDKKSAIMRFFYAPIFYSEKADACGAYIIPVNIFKGSGESALVEIDTEIESGNTFSADIEDIPAEEFDSDIMAIPFIKFDGKALTIIDADAYEGNTVNATDIDKK